MKKRLYWYKKNEKRTDFCLKLVLNNKKDLKCMKLMCLHEYEISFDAAL